MGSISPADRKIRILEAGGVAEGATEEKHASNGEAASLAMRTEKGGVAKNSCARGDGCIGRLRMVDISLRSAMVAFMVVSLSAMFTSTQHSEVIIFGLTIPVSMRWNRSQPFQFLVVVEIIVCAYSLIQFVHGSVVSATKAVATRRRMMIQLAADQTQKEEEGLKRLYDLGGQLNLDKCHIGEDEVILLGHKISYKGIEVDPSKAKALIEIPSPKILKEVNYSSLVYGDKISFQQASTTSLNNF